MKTQKFFMAFAAIAALSLGSCTQEEELLVSGNNSLDDPNAVLFSTYTGKAPQSRAGVIDTDALKEDGFGVYAYYTGTNDFVLNGGNDSVPNFMCNQEVTWDKTSSMWTYSPVKYWPDQADEKVSFFAYAPYTSAKDAEKAEYGITSLPTNTTAGDPKINYVLSENPKEQIDLLYSGDKLNLIKQNVEHKVQFNFSHAMSRIGFERVIEVDEVENNGSGHYDSDNPQNSLANGTTVTITEVSLSSTGFYKSGTLNLQSGEWSNLESEFQTYTLTSSNFTEYKTADHSNSQERKQLNSDDSYLMIFPTGKSKEIPIDITVTFNVTTLDDNLKGGKSQITSKVTTSFNFEFIEGKSYNFVLHIGLTSVKLDAVTTNWDDIWDETSNNNKSEVVVNTPDNNTVSLIYDANGGEFRNGSSQYIVTAYVGNWPDGENTEHSQKDEAMFVVKNFDSDGDICWVKSSGDTHDYEFRGWTYNQTNHESESEMTQDLLGGKTIFVPKNETSASCTIYAWWPKEETVM